MNIHVNPYVFLPPAINKLILNHLPTQATKIESFSVAASRVSIFVRDGPLANFKSQHQCYRHNPL